MSSRRSASYSRTIRVHRMHLISVCVLLCVVRRIVCCPAPDLPLRLDHTPGFFVDLNIRQWGFPEDTKAYQIYSQECGSSILIPELQSNVTLVVGKHRRDYIGTTFYYEIRNNICAYILKIQGKGWEKQIKLFDVLDNVFADESKIEKDRKGNHRVSLHVFWFDEPCIDVQTSSKRYGDVADKKPMPETKLIEEEVGVEAQLSCKELSPEITIVNHRRVLIAMLPELRNMKSTFRMRLHDFDNNTYLMCLDTTVGISESETRLTIKAKPAGEESNSPSYNKVHTYLEHETYDFECADYNYESAVKTLYYVEISEDNTLVSAASSTESTTFVKPLKLTKEKHNSKLVCMIFECRDSGGSRECSRRILNAVTLRMSATYIVDKVPSDKCQLPAYPLNGRYEVFNTPSATPFQISDFWILDITCDHGYGILGNENRFHCDSGVWLPTKLLPQCIPFCKLTPHPSVTYNCQARDNSSLYTRVCSEYEPPGMLAVAECKKPEYVSNDELPIMFCNPSGAWSNSPTCMPACGEMTPNGIVKINNGEYTDLGKLPWHVGIYQKTSTPYEQICGGSIVRPSVVISAAHCFWNDKMPDDQKLRPAAEFAVAAGKVYRPWDHPTDNQYDQKADVITINIPNRFLGPLNSFVDDLAVLLLSKSFEYQPHIAPICLNFNDHYDRIQVAKGVIGKVAAWGVIVPYWNSSPRLKVVDMSVVPYLDCYNTSPLAFRRYITGDKICAEYKEKGTAVCKGDSGAGLVVPGNDHGVTRYYLRAVVSAAPDERRVSCAANKIIAFTHVIKHYGFVKTYLL